MDNQSNLTKILPLNSGLNHELNHDEHDDNHELNHEDHNLLSDFKIRLINYSKNLLNYKKNLIIPEQTITIFNNNSNNNSNLTTPILTTNKTLLLNSIEKLNSVFSNFSLIDIEKTLFSGLINTNTSNQNNINDGEGLDIDLTKAFIAEKETKEEEDKVKGSTNDDKVLEGIPKDKGLGLFLNYYSISDLIKLFNTSGVLLALSKKGFNSPHLVFDTSDSFQHRLSLVDLSLFNSSNLISPLAPSERFLVDLYMKRRQIWTKDSMISYQLMKRLLNAGSWENLRLITGEIRAPYIGLEGAKELIEMMEKVIPRCSKSAKKGSQEWDITEIAWMQMHNPLEKVTRPLLPGQKFPGLGLGREIATVMEQMAIDSKKSDALINFPFHYHNAITYYFRGYKHLDPIYEAYVGWMTDQLKDMREQHGFCFVAWAISLGHLRRLTYFYPSSSSTTSSSSPSSSSPPPATEQSTPTLLSNKLERWSPSEQVFPTSNSMLSYFNSKEYVELLEKYKIVFGEDGGANQRGVVVGKDEERDGDEEGEGGKGERRRKAVLRIDLENCPEIWKYSNDEKWRNRNPETGEF